MQIRAQTNYGDEVTRIREEGLPQGPIARVMVFNGNGTLFIRNGSTLSEIALGHGGPAIRLGEGHSSYELLHFRLSVHELAAVPNDKYGIVLFLKGKPEFSIRDFMELTRRLAVAMDVGLITVHLRPDIWFFGFTDYPYVLPFASDLELPTKIHLQLARQLACLNDWRTGVSCTGKGFVP